MIDTDFEHGNEPPARHYRISPLASIGTPGEDARKPDPPNHGVVIGDRTTVREFVTVHGGMESPTVIGNDVYIMAHSHVGHDARISDGVTLATRATIGGHCYIHEGANIGLSATVHQRVTVGAYAMIGMGSAVIRDVPPFTKWAGVPAKQIGYNRIGMERAGFTAEQIAEVEAGGILSGPAGKHYVKYEEERGRHK